MTIQENPMNRERKKGNRDLIFSLVKKQNVFVTGLGGFEPPTSGLEARRYVQAKPQAQLSANKFGVL